MLKKIIFFGLILVLIFMITGCTCRKKSKLPRGKVTLTYWRPVDEVDKFKPLIDLYRKDHPNVTINYVLKNQATYEEELLNALAAGTGPDIFTIKDDWILKHLDKLYPMPSEIMSVEQYNKIFAPVVSQKAIQDGKIYVVPLSLQVLGLFYNQQLINDYNRTVESNEHLSAKEVESLLIQEPPATWNDFIDQVKKLTKKNGESIQQAGVAMGTAKNTNEAVDILSLLMLQNNTTMYSDDGKSATFNLPLQKASGEQIYPGTVALDFYTSFARVSKETYSWNESMPSSLESFIQGKAAMIFAYPEAWSEINRLAPTMKVRVAPVPQIKGTTKKLTYAKFWAEAVSKNSPNKETAWNFLNFLIDKENNTDFVQAISAVPARIDVANVMGSSHAAFAEQRSITTSWPKTKKPDDVDRIFSEMISNVLQGMSLQTAIDKAASEVTKILQQQLKETGSVSKID